ncbi:hypothetical protein HID58_066200, partial [Brassica napus]
TQLAFQCLKICLAYYLTKSPKTRLLSDTIGPGSTFLFSLVFGLIILSFVMVYKHDSFTCGCIQPCSIVATAVAEMSMGL